MNCEDYREEFSALLDREEPMLAVGVLDKHLARCSSCTDWAASATQLHRAACVAVAPEVPDLVEPILAAAVRQRPDARPAFDVAALVRVARLVLASIGIAELVTAVPGLFASNQSGTALHSIHELGSFDVALAVGFLAAAFRPSLGRGMLPLVVALVGALAAVTISDVVSSHAGWGAESAHLLSVVGIPMLWLASRRADDAPRMRSGSQWRHASARLVTG